MLEIALDHAARLLESEPELAVAQATEILKAVPDHPPAMLLLGKALAASGRGEEAVTHLRRTLQIAPDLSEAWRALADHLRAIGDERGADTAAASALKASTRDPRLQEAAAALCENRIAAAEALLRKHLGQQPNDVAALRLLAEVAARLGRFTDAEELLGRCLALAPGFAAARQDYALVLHAQNRTQEALDVVDELLARQPRNPGLRASKASMLSRLGDFAPAIELYAEVLREYPQQAKAWMSYGHVLKTANRERESIDAYLRSLELAPHLGEAWWSLANLKTFRFDDAQVDAMRAQLARDDLAAEDRYHFDFAVGKALEDRREYAESFTHYSRGNVLRRAGIAYDADELSADVRRTIEVFTAGMLGQRHGCGDPADDPIFIIGLPRAGSTLLEQVLSSHSQVEGTTELPDILALVRQLSGPPKRSGVRTYPAVLATLPDDELRRLGQRYLAQTRVQRRTAAPRFIDKMPNNWLHVGLIHLILPNARIVDARRHPLGCCFSNFKQHFARGQHFTYDLRDLGRYYADYARLMSHFDAVLPGRIHRVDYARMVTDTGHEIRRLLDYCGLEFEESCLQFYANPRAVRTASSQQVRSPIYRDAVDQWRHYESWLDPLKETLGPVLAAADG